MRAGFLETSKPWRVFILTPAGWTRVSGAYFATHADAMQWISTPDSQVKW